MEVPVHQLPPCEAVTLAFEDIAYSVNIGHRLRRKKRESRLLLNRVSGLVRPGQLLFIMGPSGCGKTTILDLFARRIKSGRMTGAVRLNGQQDVPDAAFRSISAYVPQEDSLIGDFTVKETLMYAARLWLKVPNAEREERVNRLITGLGLESAANTVVGTVFRKGLSGGQKRRLSLGVELIANPSLIFLDEPTSGLDSAAAYHIVAMLKSLCAAGRTIICTIHQPSSEVFHASDLLLLLSKGNEVYFGPSHEVVAHFSALGYPCPHETNPADHILTILNTDFPGHGDLEQISNAFAQSQQMARLGTELAQLQAGNPLVEQEKPAVLSEAAVLLHRGFLYILRNPGLYWVRLAMYTILAFVLGTLYWRQPFTVPTIQDRISLLFFVAAFMVFMSIAVLPQFLLDKPVFVRERASGSYGPLVYVVAQTITSIPGLLLISAAASSLVYWLANLNPSGVRFMWFLLCLFTSLFAAEGLIHLISALVPYFIVGLMVAAGLYGFFMLVEGFLVKPSHIPGYWIWGYYIAFHTYTFKTFMYNEFSDEVFTSTNGGSFQFPNGTITGKQVLDQYDIHDDTRAINIGILVGFGILFRILYYFALKFFHTGKR